MACAQACGQTVVSHVLAELLGQSAGTVRQRLREWCWEAEAKAGRRRVALDVTLCFGPLLSWIVSWWPTEERRLALALDATTLSDRFIILVVSVVYRGVALPVAWTVISSHTKKAWKPEWLRLLGLLAPAIPETWLVIVLADRGLYADWLFRAIQTQHWHPFLRLNTGGKYRLPNQSDFRPLTEVVRQPGQTWQGAVVCFKHHPVTATLLACWETPHTTPWLILTDLPPDQAQAVWYRLRTWIECGFKFTKRAGWHWQASRMTDPARAERFWLALAVATLWVVSVGGEVDASLPASTLEALPPTHIARRTRSARAASKPRLWACFRRGIIAILGALICHQTCRVGRFYPEPWPIPEKTYP